MGYKNEMNDMQRADADSLERYRPRRLWLPDRPHRGFACSGDDAERETVTIRPRQHSYNVLLEF